MYAKSNRRKYGVTDGVLSFTRLASMMKKLTKEYGGLHPRVKLKETDEIDE
jgi:hypothetical protein